MGGCDSPEHNAPDYIRALLIRGFTPSSARRLVRVGINWQGGEITLADYAFDVLLTFLAFA